MAAKPRRARAILSKLRDQFIQYNISQQPTYEEYLNTVKEEPVTRRVVRKNFQNRWVRLMSALIRTYPGLYDEVKEAHVEKPKPVKISVPKKEVVDG